MTSAPETLDFLIIFIVIRTKKFNSDQSKMDVQDIMGVQTPKRGQGTPRKTPTKIKRPGNLFTPPPTNP
jgi:hypothetical protein